MSNVDLPEADLATKAGGVPLLEKLTTAVLILVLLALGLMIVAAYLPADESLLPRAWEPAAVLVVVGLLFTALGLVSAVALLHTR